MSDIPSMTLVDAIVAERLSRSAAAASTDVALVAEVMAETGLQSNELQVAARAILDHSCALRFEGEAARGRLGIPDDGRPTLFSIWEAPSDRCQASVVFDAVALRAFALALFASGSSWACVDMPEEATTRLKMANDRPALRQHFRRTAADHFAAHIIRQAMEITSVSSFEQRVVWTGSFPVDGIADAFAWLSLPGPGRYASTVTLITPPGALA